ncbi:MAG: galactose mutarotase, partial [Peptostreptococcaceae bacterium]|nr:galactose mutarotase [Peptostreptococcaceae bacterium]
EGSKQAVVYEDPISRRRMYVTTDQKVVVIYSMNFADDPKCLQNGEMAKVRMGICFETQSLPIGYEDCFIEDSILRAGEKYEKESCFKFEW